MNARSIGEATDDEQVVFCLTSAPRPYLKPSAHYGVGSVLAGKYRLDSVLGEGSVGTVWQATNLLLDSPVAIKLTHAELAGPEFRARLQLEARAAASLGHPAIIRVFDVGETNLGDLFIVMELLQGATLAQMIAGGKLTAVRTVQIVLPIIDALAAMHARGIVHRDVKPDNLFISLEDRTVQPKILDFGIAKLNESRGKVGHVSESGMLVGSPEYMSPEQAMACDDIDFRTDIWSVCVALYEAMSGETPFATVSDDALLGAITELEPASLAESGDCDEQLWEIVHIGLAKDRYARHASMADLGRALASWLAGHGITEDACGTSLESRWFADDPVRPFASTPDVCDVEVAKPELREVERTLPPESSPPSMRRAQTRTVTHRRPGVGAIKALTLAAVVVTAFFAVTSNHDLSSLIAISKGATATGARRAASVAAQALARQRRRGSLGLLAP
jgi:serine/threonine-protein kinase